MLASMGLTVSDAVRVFLTRVVADKELPFSLKAPNEQSMAAMAEANTIVQHHKARFATVDDLITERLSENNTKLPTSLM